jgi:hypothetical protein
MTTNNEMHAELIDAGWRVGLDGRWHSPHPSDARFTIKTPAAAWQVHVAHRPDDHAHLATQPQQ